MESSHPHPANVDALADLEHAERTRAEFAAGLAVPPGYDVVLGAAVAVQIATAALALTTTSASRAGLLVLGGLAVFGLAAGAQVLQFRRRNGARLSGFVHQATFGVSWPAALGYAVALAAALVAADARVWPLMGLAAVCGGVAWAVSGVRWMRRYRAARVPAPGAVDARLGVAAAIAVAVAAVILVVAGRV